jgi:hypothetical protein
VAAKRLPSALMQTIAQNARRTSQQPARARLRRRRRAAEQVFKFRERFAATAFWEVFNLFNYDNFYNFQGSLQSSSFGNPQSEFPKRAQQGGFRFEF